MAFCGLIVRHGQPATFDVPAKRSINVTHAALAPGCPNGDIHVALRHKGSEQYVAVLNRDVRPTLPLRIWARNETEWRVHGKGATVHLLGEVAVSPDDLNDPSGAFGQDVKVAEGDVKNVVHDDDGDDGSGSDEGQGSDHKADEGDDEGSSDESGDGDDDDVAPKAETTSPTAAMAALANLGDAALLADSGDSSDDDEEEEEEEEEENGEDDDDDSLKLDEGLTSDDGSAEESGEEDNNDDATGVAVGGPLRSDTDEDEDSSDDGLMLDEVGEGLAKPVDDDDSEEDEEEPPAKKAAKGLGRKPRKGTAGGGKSGTSEQRGLPQGQGGSKKRKRT